MPGTLLPHEILADLTAMAGRILAEVLASENGDPLTGDSVGPALYLVEHSIDATALGVSIGRRLVALDELEDLGTGLFLQDIGKLALPPRLVYQAGPVRAG